MSKLRIVNTTGIANDTKIYCGDELVTNILEIRIQIGPRDTVVSATLELVLPEIDVVAEVT